jgi:hypothetical protein
MHHISDPRDEAWEPLDQTNLIPPFDQHLGSFELHGSMLEVVERHWSKGEVGQPPMTSGPPPLPYGASLLDVEGGMKWFGGSRHVRWPHFGILMTSGPHLLGGDNVASLHTKVELIWPYYVCRPTCQVWPIRPIFCTQLLEALPIIIMYLSIGHTWGVSQRVKLGLQAWFFIHSFYTYIQIEGMYMWNQFDKICSWYAYLPSFQGCWRWFWV